MKHVFYPYGLFDPFENDKPKLLQRISCLLRTISPCPFCSSTLPCTAFPHPLYPINPSLNDVDAHGSSGMRTWLLLYGRCTRSLPHRDYGLVPGAHLPFLLRALPSRLFLWGICPSRREVWGGPMVLSRRIKLPVRGRRWELQYRRVTGYTSRAGKGDTRPSRRNLINAIPEPRTEYFRMFLSRGLYMYLNSSALYVSPYFSRRRPFARQGRTARKAFLSRVPQGRTAMPPAFSRRFAQDLAPRAGTVFQERLHPPQVVVLQRQIMWDLRVLRAAMVLKAWETRCVPAHAQRATSAPRGRCPL